LEDGWNDVLASRWVGGLLAMIRPLRTWMDVVMSVQRPCMDGHASVNVGLKR
jgi:hypothetical protein